MPYTNKEEGGKKYVGLDSGLSFEKQEYLNTPSPTEEKKGEATGEWEKGLFEDFIMNWSAENHIWWVDEDDNTQWNVNNNIDACEKLKDFIRKTLSTTEQANRKTIEKAEYWLWHVVANWGRKDSDPEVKEDLLKAHKILKDALSPQEHTKE